MIIRKHINSARTDADVTTGVTCTYHCALNSSQTPTFWLQQNTKKRSKPHRRTNIHPSWESFGSFTGDHSATPTEHVTAPFIQNK
jgi:hypothetical protein